MIWQPGESGTAHAPGLILLAGAVIFALIMLTVGVSAAWMEAAR